MTVFTEENTHHKPSRLYNLRHWRFHPKAIWKDQPVFHSLATLTILERLKIFRSIDLQLYHSIPNYQLTVMVSRTRVLDRLAWISKITLVPTLLRVSNSQWLSPPSTLSQLRVSWIDSRLNMPLCNSRELRSLILMYSRKLIWLPKNWF